MNKGESIVEKDLKLEVYASKKCVEPIQFHVYQLHSNKIEENKFKIIRSACRKLQNYNSIGIFENGEKIYTTEQIGNIPTDIDFELEYLGKELLSVEENKKIYEEVIEYYIWNKLRNLRVYDKYRKYACGNDEIMTSWIKNGDKYEILKTGPKGIRLQRKFDIKVEVKEDKKAYLWIVSKSVFEALFTIDDLMKQQVNICGMDVKNSWGSFRQTGKVVEICDFTVTDTIDFVKSLKDYYITKKKEEYRVKDLPDDTPVIKVEMDRSGVIFHYYPQALKPIVTREYIQKHYPEFSKKIECYIKRNMENRVETDKDFIKDIGVLDEINQLSFETQCCPVEQLGFVAVNEKLRNYYKNI